MASGTRAARRAMASSTALVGSLSPRSMVASMVTKRRAATGTNRKSTFPFPLMSTTQNPFSSSSSLKSMRWRLPL